MDRWINDRMILVNAENTPNLRNQFLCVSMILCRIFWEHKILATRGFAKKGIGTHNQVDCCDEVSESRAMLRNKNVVSSRISIILLHVFFAGGVPCPQWTLEAENNAVVASQNISRRCWFVTPRNTYNNHAHIEASLGVPSNLFKSQNSYWRFSPKINLVQILTRESSISPGCHGPIFCTWPTLPMRPEPICIARERHGLFWKGCASMLGLIVPEGDGIPSEICFKSGDVVDIILIWGVQWYQITRKKQPDNYHVQRWHIYNSWGLLIVCLDPKWMPGVRHILTCVHAAGIGRL